MNADDLAKDANGLAGDQETGRVASEGDRIPAGDFGPVLQQVMEYAGGDRALAAEWLGISADTLDLLLLESGRDLRDAHIPTPDFIDDDADHGRCTGLRDRGHGGWMSRGSNLGAAPGPEEDSGSGICFLWGLLRRKRCAPGCDQTASTTAAMPRPPPPQSICTPYLPLMRLRWRTISPK